MACEKCGVCGTRPDCPHLLKNKPKKIKPIKNHGKIEDFWIDMIKRWEERYGRV